MTPVSLTWGMIDNESRAEGDLPNVPSQSEPTGPFALADVLTEIVARYARPERGRPVSVSWLAIHDGTVSMPVVQR
jgi:hypothetical protein